MSIRRTKIREALDKDGDGAEMTLMGWVRNIRPQKNRTFIHLNDGSTIQHAQVVADPSLDNYEAVLRMGVGSSVAVQGRWVESAGRGQKSELIADRIVIVGEADAEKYPLQPKRHSFEFLREIAHLRTRTNTFGAVFRIRGALARATHDFFGDRGFVYVHSPILTGSDCEGAGEMFQVTTMDLAAVPKTPAGQVDFGRDFFGKQAGLTVSGQLEAELMALGLGDVYTFGPTFRAENSNTARHLSEFWMVEPEMAFCDLEDDIDLAEDYLRALVSDVLHHHEDDLAFLEKNVSKGLVAELERCVDRRFARVSYQDVLRIMESSGRRFEFPVTWGMDLQTEHERFLCEEHFKGPVVVYNYPKESKAFYMRVNDDDKTVAAMDVLLPRVGEIIGGSQREERYDVLERRMAEFGLSQDDYRWYLDTRRFGTVPHAGFGLGFGRAVQYATGMANIRDAVPFPRAPRNLEF
ncbi:MAG: asparagine--tRNA ligase [Deltaproteobacteria bacterium]|nr:asparagine--tRNA ligase [Deltaproteobacteria bacterium]